MIESINPATLEVNAKIEETPAGKVKDVFELAREVQPEWDAMGVARRAEHLIRVKQHVMDRVDDIAGTITADNGKTLLEAVNAEIFPVLDMLNFCSREAPKLLRGEKLSNPIFPIARIESGNIFEPLGVIGIISPWNFPFAIPMTQIAMALIAGNTVVLKPAELTALTGDLINEIFAQSGLPDGVVNIIQGDGPIIGGEMMAARPDRVVFTGSVPVGKLLMKQAAETLIPITLELGGKDPFIVLEDADIDRASSAAVWGAFINAGQVCASVERVYVHQSVADEFIRLVVEKTNKLRVGNGAEHNVDMGPMIEQKRIDMVEAHLADAVKKGAKILTGGSRIDDLAGYFFKPTVIANVDHSMECMKEETFGPTLPIMTYSDIEEAVELANDSKYGLTASVWSPDIAEAKKICRRIKTGTAVVNNCLMTYGFSQCPWGGVKDSGIGRTHSVHGLYEFTNIKNITVNRNILKDDLWWYPYGEPKYKGMKAAMKTLFCEGVVCKGEGIVDMLKSFNLLGGK